MVRVKSVKCVVCGRTVRPKKSEPFWKKHLCDKCAERWIDPIFMAYEDAFVSLRLNPGLLLSLERSIHEHIVKHVGATARDRAALWQMIADGGKYQ